VDDRAIREHDRAIREHDRAIREHDRAIREHDRAGWVLGTWSIQLELGGRQSGLCDEVQGLF
jgi:hypothetical protein